MTNASDVILRARGLGKMYTIYDKPSDRLKQMVFGQLYGKVYGRPFWALRDFDCDLKRGSMLGIIGRNGSGKSTLLQILCGTLTATCGQVVVNGRISALLELGSGFNPEFSGRDNVFVYGAVLGMSEIEMRKRFDRIVDFADIGHFIDQPVKTYSSGMTVRLAFAVAGSIDPDILIIDEALAVGDHVFQQRCYKRFQEMRDKGTSVIFVSHDLNSIIQYCDDALVLDHGVIIGRGNPKSMVDLYKKNVSVAVPRAKIEASAGSSQLRDDQMRNAFPRNPNAQEFGSGVATIIDWGLCDEYGMPISVICGDAFFVCVKVIFHARCEAPIVTFTFRDLKGNDITGSNTMYERAGIGLMQPGSLIGVKFGMRLALAPGPYTLSTSCTEISSQGLIVHHRLYDIFIFESAPKRKFAGVIDPGCHVELLR